jgi:type IX secretion system PorP/SprF family membrane protein
MNHRNMLKFFLRGFLPLFMFFETFPLLAQQDPQFTQYMFNGMYYNPAFAGKDGGFRFSALHRSQWLNYTTSAGNGGAPVTQLITAQGRLDKKNIGYGLTLVNDRIGPSNSLEMNFQGAYHKSIKKGTLSIGAFAGVFSTALNYDDLVVVNPEPNLPSLGRETKINFNAGLGILLEKRDYYLGLSSRHINEPTFDFGGGNFENKLENHSYLLMGYRFRKLGTISIEPSFLVKSVSFNNFSYDVSVMVTHLDKINAGLAIRGEESASIILGYSLLKDNSLKVGYSFDLVTEGKNAKAPSSHELMLRYNLQNLKINKGVERFIQRTPRFRF